MRTILSIISFFIVTTILAIPAYREWRFYLQSDGSTLELMQIGDEHLHYYITRDNVPVVGVDDAFYYAKVEDGMIMPTSCLVHDQSLRTMAESLTAKTAKFSLQHSNVRYMRAPSRLPQASHGKYVGKRKGLIILANFDNMQFVGYSEQTADSIREVYDDIANKQGYTNEYGAIGSVHDYYYDQSNGLFDLEFDVVGPVNLTHPYEYYGKNMFGSDYYAPYMIIECCEAVDSLVNFADYDWDGDGIVEEVFVLYAGKGEATGGGSNTIWPHMWTLEEAHMEVDDIPDHIVLDDHVINVYACSNEIYATGKPMGLGVICHEFSHCLGLPDLYDTNTGKNFGMGSWSILDYGTYNGPHNLGWVPAGFTSYERNFAGWLEYTPLVNDTIVENMLPVNELNAEAYVIYNDSVPSEYYLLENRNKTRWDAYIPGKGLLIMHVDFDQDLWDENYVNATGYAVGNDHQRLTIFHADNSEYLPYDAFPYLDNDSLTDFSTPEAILYNANIDDGYLMHKPITHIMRDDSLATISFQFQNRSLRPVPDAIYTYEDKKSGEGIRIYKLDGTSVNATNADSYHSSGMFIIRDEEKGMTKKVIKR